MGASTPSANSHPPGDGSGPLARVSAALADRYRVERELGAGGMATVYLAEDLKHKRKVAVKVLRPELAAVLGAERFLQEITTTAALQHPHILPLFDSGTAEGLLYYVMPYIQGETLRAKLERETQLAVDEAVRITVDVADALQYAHGQGVIHRDIKPENILLANGRPMVADFGIALAVSAAAGGRMTETGLSLGTPHYMSPEQATAEKLITGRSDTYSLASVLYEMLTGSPPHVGSSAQQIIMKIIAEPVAPVTTLRKSVPAHVADAVAKALEKLPADRFESAQAFSQALTDPRFTTAVAAPAWRETAGRRSVLVTTLGAVALLLAGTAGGWSLRRPAPELPTVRFSIPVDGAVSGLDVSADGSRVFFKSRAEAHVRDLDADSLLAVEPGASREPRMSADGRSVIGGTEDVIVLVDVAGGQPRAIVRTEPLGRAIWGHDGFVYFDRSGGLARIPVAGGPVDTLLRADPSGRAIIAMDALPDGRSLLVILAVGTAVSAAASDTVALFDIATGALTPLFPAAFSRGGVRYSATGHIVYGDRGRILARTFDAGNGTVGSDAITLVDGGADVRGLRFAIGGRTLAYVPSEDDNRTLTLADRRGERRPLANLPAGHYENPRISPQGDRIAVLRTDPNDNQRDLWVYDLASGRLSPVTRSGGVGNPAWSPDGQRLAYTRGSELHVRRFDASGEEELLLRRPRRFGAIAWTRDLLVFQEGPGAWDIGVATIGKPGSDSLLLQGDYWEGAPAVSRDGRWLAYYSSEGGQAQMFVRPFMRAGRKLQVSSTGSTNGRWSHDGRRLFYGQGTTLMEAQLTIGEEVTVASVHRLFDIVGGSTGTLQFDVFPDGDRFAITERAGGAAARAITVVSDFHRLLRRE